MRPHTTHHDDCGCKSAAYEQRIAELEWEVERRECCGTCEHLRGVDCHYCGTEDDWDMMVDILDRCHFTPSRWELAEELRDV